MIAAELGGDRVQVRSILPPGADPHTYEPRPSDAIAVAESSVIVMLGSSIDDWIGDEIPVPDGSIVVRLDAGKDSDEHRDEHADEHADGHEGGHDPHVWLDPSWVRDHAVPAIYRALAAADPQAAARYGFAARAMAEKLTDLEDDVREVFLLAPMRSFLAWHPAWQPFAHRFRLHPVGSLGEGEGREPSLREMIAAVRAGRASNVRAVLVEPQTDSRQASVLAEELGVPLVIVDPLGDMSSVDRATYQTLMLFNARAFARALGVEAKKEDDEPAPVSALPVSPGGP